MIISKIQESYIFVSSKPFGNLLEIYPKNHIFLKIFNSEFKAVEIEDIINLTLVIK